MKTAGLWSLLAIVLLAQNALANEPALVNGKTRIDAVLILDHHTKVHGQCKFNNNPT